MHAKSLINQVYANQHSSLIHLPDDRKKITLSSYVYDVLIMELEFLSDSKIDKNLPLKVIGMDVQVVQSNDIFISISAK